MPDGSEAGLAPILVCQLLPLVWLSSSQIRNSNATRATRRRARQAPKCVADRKFLWTARRGQTRVPLSSAAPRAPTRWRPHRAEPSGAASVRGVPPTKTSGAARTSASFRKPPAAVDRHIRHVAYVSRAGCERRAAAGRRLAVARDGPERKEIVRLCVPRVRLLPPLSEELARGHEVGIPEIQRGHCHAFPRVIIQRNFETPAGR